MSNKPYGVLLLALLLHGCCATPQMRALEQIYPIPVSHIPNEGFTDPATTNEVELSYPLLLPPVLKPKTTYRFILVFHGAGDSMQNYAALWSVFAKKHDTIIAVPGLNKSNLLYNAAQDGALYFELLKSLQAQYPIDEKRMYVAGASMGSGSATLMARLQPALWRGVILVAATGYFASIPRVAAEKTDNYTAYPPFLYLHGTRDADNYRRMLEGSEYLIEKGVPVMIHSDPDAGHEHRPEWNERIFEWIENVEEKTNRLSENSKVLTE